MLKRKQEKGVTLIALVITIIVLLILAGITINLALDPNGIVRRSEQARNEYQNAQEKELAGIKELINEMNSITTDNKSTVPEPQEWSEPYTETSLNNYTDSNGDSATIPAGFQVSLEHSTINDGLVIRNAEDGNEFVWILVDDTNEYKRRAFLETQPVDIENPDRIKASTSSSYYYIEEMPEDELTSVTKYKGYYIGRYEAGIEGYTGEPSKLNSESSTDWTGYSGGTLVIQEEKQVWNYITKEKAKEVSKSLYNKEKDNVTSKLCSSYAWDTALSFIAKTNDDYPTNSTEGNYSGELKKTGETTAVNNIYDMGGNVLELTTEVCSNGSSPCTGRGYSIYASDDPAGYRNYNKSTDAAEDMGFRVTLYL